MKRKLWLYLLVNLIVIGVIGYQIGAQVLYNSTVRIVDSVGNVIGGTASAVTANYNSTVRVVDSTGHVLNSFSGGVSGTYPSGSPPQIGGFSAANVPEAETVSGDCAFTRAGANSYTIACTKTNGTAFGALATLGVGTGLVSSGGNLNVSAFIQAMTASTAMTNYGGL